MSIDPAFADLTPTDVDEIPDEPVLVEEQDAPEEEELTDEHAE